MIIFIFIISLFLPIETYANSWGKIYTPGSDSDFFQKRITYSLSISPGTDKLQMTQYKPGLPMTSKNIIKRVVWKVKGNTVVWVDQTCRGAMSFVYQAKNGRYITSHVRGETYNYLGMGSCKSKDVIKKSTYIPSKNKYKNDTFGKKVK